MAKVTYEDIKNNNEINTYIELADKLLGTLGFTKHDFGHVAKVAETASNILLTLGYSEREAELSKIAGYTHDIGNMVNRVDHAQTGAALCFNILTRLGMDPSEIALVISAIGNHDEGTGSPVNSISSALILGDKSDVRRSRVRNTDFSTFDIHDRVNYAVEHSEVSINPDNRSILLDLKIDTSISSLMDYFEIFLTRMIMCRKAADYLKVNFELVMNGTKII
jgi:metal-dependent HD superfamily phosphatase/phosphodiesterase